MTFDTALALLTLTCMEIVLGIDNIIFIAILTGKLAADKRALARRLGIALALVARLALLFSLSWIMKLTEPLFEVLEKSVSGRDLILLVGGAFLIAKATYEIHEKLEVGEHPPEVQGGRAQFGNILLQIMVLDIIFSLDSVITAVGMANEIWVMVTAMMISVGVMLLAANAISDFVHRHPTIKILALAFLILIGVMLAAEGLGAHVSKGYIYFAMSFSLVVELLNIRFRSRGQKVPAAR